MENQTPGELLAKFYADNNLDADGGQNASSVKIELTSAICFYFPNFNARRRAVIKHDIHHLLTGYETNVAGESEISAWEIASGCKSYWAAFLIDSSGVMLGVLFNFWDVLKAFSRGRRTKNLYHELFSTEKALGMKIGELQTVLGLNDHPKNTRPTFIDFCLFSLFLVFGTIYSVLSLVLLPFIILYTLYEILKPKKTITSL
ncbi:MAG: uncharacterized protein K0S33_3297 [Bacteroidetes bacterium]|jgi:ubiquinone biosynthesis protein Coq4|nr:uncharacterized protein [Bacteroidota bacterium]